MESEINNVSSIQDVQFRSLEEHLEFILRNINQADVVNSSSLIYRGGWIEKADFFKCFKFSSNEEVLGVLNSSTTSDGAKKFEIINGKLGADQEENIFIRARNGHSFDINNDSLLQIDESFYNQPSRLFDICVTTVVQNIKLYSKLGDIQDQTVVGILWAAVVKGHTMGNPIIRVFATENAASLDLGAVSSFVTPSTIIHIGKTCKCLCSLSLKGCLVLNDNLLEYITKRCTKITSLDISYCPGITNKSIVKMLEHHLPLKTLLMENCPQISVDVCVYLFNLQIENLLANIDIDNRLHWMKMFHFSVEHFTIQ